MKALDEYLRRNLLHAAAVGAHAGANNVLRQLLRTARPQRWLVDALKGIAERSGSVADEMARHRDELSPYRKEA